MSAPSPVERLVARVLLWGGLLSVSLILAEKRGGIELGLAALGLVFLSKHQAGILP